MLRTMDEYLSDYAKMIKHSPDHGTSEVNKLQMYADALLCGYTPSSIGEAISVISSLDIFEVIFLMSEQAIGRERIKSAHTWIADPNRPHQNDYAKNTKTGGANEVFFFDDNVVHAGLDVLTLSVRRPNEKCFLEIEFAAPLRPEIRFVERGKQELVCALAEILNELPAHLFEPNELSATCSGNAPRAQLLTAPSFDRISI